MDFIVPICYVAFLMWVFNKFYEWLIRTENPVVRAAILVVGTASAIRNAKRAKQWFDKP